MTHLGITKTLQTFRLNTLENLAITYNSRLNNLEQETYDIGTTLITFDTRLDGIDAINLSHETRIDDLEAFNYGATMAFGSTGVSWTESAVETIGDVVDYAGYIVDAVNVSLWTFHAAQEIKNAGFTTFIANQTGINADNSAYQVLNDAENVVQNTTLATHTGTLASLGIAVAADTAAIAVVGVSVAELTTDNGIHFSNASILGVSVGVLDAFKHSFSLATTQALVNIGTSTTNLSSKDYNLETRIATYENRIDLTSPLGITWKGATIPGMNLSDSLFGVSVNILARKDLTVSGTFQSPLTSLQGVSIGVLDTYRTAMVGTSMPNYLTRNETILPSSFLASSLTSLGTLSSLIVSGQSTLNTVIGVSNLAFIDTSLGEKIVLWGRTASNYYGLGITSGTIYIHGDSGGSVSIGNGSNINSYTEGIKVNTNGACIFPNGNITMNKNLTVSGVFQSPLTTLIGVSIGVIDLYKGTMLSTSMPQYLTRNETVLPSSFVSSSLTSLGTLSSLVCSGNMTVSGVLQSPLTSLIGVSISAMDVKLYGALGASGSNYLTRNETILPSSFINSSLKTFGTSGKFGANQVVDVNLPDVALHVSNYPNDTNIVISSSESDKSGLFFGTPNDNTVNTSAKTAIIVQGQTYGRGIMKFCFNDNTAGLSHQNSNTTINDSVVSIDRVATNLLSVSGNIGSTGTYISYNSGSAVWMAQINATYGHINTTNAFRLYTQNAGVISLEANGASVGMTNLGITGNQVNSGNLTISGILQSPLTSLIGVSVGVIDLYKGTMLSTSMPQYLTRNETTLPSSFISSSLTSLGTLSSLVVSGNLTVSGYVSTVNTNDNVAFGGLSNSNNYIQFISNGVPDNSFYIGKIGADMVLSTSGALIFKKYGGTENSRIDTSGNWIKNNNLTVSGVFQSPLTSLIGVSIANLTTNAGVISSSTWGTTGFEKTINTNSYVNINTQDTQNSYLRFGYGGAYTLFGQVNTNDAFVRLKNSSGVFRIENTSGTGKLTVDTNGNTSIAGTFGCGALSASTGTFSGNIDATGNNVLRGADALQLTHTGNCSFKMSGGSYTYRYETQTGDSHYLWDGANNEVYHVDSGNNLWFQADVNCSGTFYDSGIPLVASSGRLKKNVKTLKDIPDRKTILDQIEFKKYTKNYKNKEYDEIGIVIEDLEAIDGIEQYDFIQTRGECEDPEVSGLKYLKYVPFFMTLISEMKERIIQLERKHNN